MHPINSAKNALISLQIRAFFCILVVNNTSIMDVYTLEQLYGLTIEEYVKKLNNEEKKQLKELFQRLIIRHLEVEETEVK